MFRQLRPAIGIFLAFTFITGVVYPLVVTAIAQGLFSHRANGSLIEQDGQTVGSELIGQAFDEPQYFWGRLSATSPFAYNAGSSGGSNLGPTNPALIDAAKGRIDALKAADPENDLPIPVDLVTSSASGLDPHISPAAAEYQVNRVAKARNVDAQAIRKLVSQFTEGRTLGLLGESRVNVLLVNRALNKEFSKP